MTLADATLDELIAFLEANPVPTAFQTGELLLNLTQKLKRLETGVDEQRLPSDGLTAVA